MELDNIINTITRNDLFLRLKEVVENIHGFHDHEDVYAHLVKTADIARREREGEFVTNPQAKQLFSHFMDEKIAGIKRKDIIVLIALLHDCGKLLSTKEGYNVQSINIKKPNAQTSCPGHEYWGGTLVVGEILKNISLGDEIKNYISSVVRLHDTFGAYFEPKKDWQLDDLVWDIKARAEGLYKETLFNIYCDCYTASVFEYSKKQIEKVFNVPSLYIERTYFISEI